MGGTRIKVEYEGRTVSLVQLAELTGIAYGTLLKRYNCGLRGAALAQQILDEDIGVNKKTWMHNLWGGVWCYKGEPVQAGTQIRHSNLKPCPFCGAKVHIEKLDDEGYYMVQCDNDDCAAAVCFGDSSEDLIKAKELWNRRVAKNTTQVVNTGTMRISL